MTGTEKPGKCGLHDIGIWVGETDWLREGGPGRDMSNTPSGMSCAGKRSVKVVVVRLKANRF